MVEAVLDVGSGEGLPKLELVGDVEVFQDVEGLLHGAHRHPKHGLVDAGVVVAHVAAVLHEADDLGAGLEPGEAESTVDGVGEAVVALVVGGLAEEVVDGKLTRVEDLLVHAAAVVEEASGVGDLLLGKESLVFLIELVPSSSGNGSAGGKLSWEEEADLFLLLDVLGDEAREADLGDGVDIVKDA